MLHHYNFLWDVYFDKSTARIHFLLIPTMHAKLKDMTSIKMFKFSVFVFENNT